jgi:two-component system response regulator NreC
LGRSRRIFKIFVADPHALFRRGLCALCAAESDLQFAGDAASTAELPDKIRETTPDLLVIDLGMVHGEGERDLFAARQAHPALGILFLTRQDGPLELEKAIMAGARGYMTKGSTPGQLVAGIRQALLGDYRPHSLSRTVPDLRALDGPNREYAPKTLLTSREQEVMMLLAEGRTVREVALDLALSVKTIEAHKLNLMRKLDIHDRASLIEYAVKQGVVAAPVA